MRNVTIEQFTQIDACLQLWSISTRIKIIKIYHLFNQSPIHKLEQSNQKIIHRYHIHKQINITNWKLSIIMDLIDQKQKFLQYITQLYYDAANQTEKYWKRDNLAALKIQSKFKMYLKRKDFKKMKDAAIKIQTRFRGYYARKQFKTLQLKDFNQKNLRYFANQAIIIQKIFRGFYVRKYLHNFYERKQELKALERKNQEFRQSLEQFGKAQAVEAEQYKKQLSKAQFSALAKNLHHLTSTKNIPGVYNSPFMFDKPKVFEKEVEEHLKDAFKRTYKWKGVSREDMLKHNTIKATTTK